MTGRRALTTAEVGFPQPVSLWLHGLLLRIINEYSFAMLAMETTWSLERRKKPDKSATGNSHSSKRLMEVSLGHRGGI